MTLGVTVDDGMRALPHCTYIYIYMYIYIYIYKNIYIICVCVCVSIPSGHCRSSECYFISTWTQPIPNLLRSLVIARNIQRIFVLVSTIQY